MPKVHWPIEGQVEFRDVKLSYRSDGPLVLKGVSFKVNAGEKIGVVGRTGAGKSTLMLALSRIVEISGGTIEIDGENIAKIPLKILRQKVTVIPQDASLFAGTLRYNLDPANQETDERLMEVIHKASLDRLQGQLDFEISSNGSNLSAGEKQLICICRAVLRVITIPIT